MNASVAFAWAVRKFKFTNALNVGAAGLSISEKTPKKIELGKCYKISKVNCLAQTIRLLYARGVSLVV